MHQPKYSLKLVGFCGKGDVCFDVFLDKGDFTMNGMIPNSGQIMSDHPYHHFMPSIPTVLLTELSYGTC